MAKAKERQKMNLKDPRNRQHPLGLWPHDSAEYGHAGYLLCIETLMLQQGKREDMTRQKSSTRWKSKSLVYLAR